MAYAKYSGSITGINIVLYWNNPAGMSGITTLSSDGSSNTQIIPDGTPCEPSAPAKISDASIPAE